MDDSRSESSNGSIQGSPFRHKIEDLPTRHPTTIKKKQRPASSFRRGDQSEPVCEKIHYSARQHSGKPQRLRQSIMTLQGEKYRCMESGRYHRAFQLQSRISRTKSLLGKAELKELSKNHKREKKLIKSAYQQEVAFFQSAWANYYQQYRERQEAKLEQFKHQQMKQIELIREKLRRKCGSLRYPNRDVMDLEKQEQYHLKHGNITELMLIRKQKKKIVSHIKMQRNELINKWTQIQGHQLENYQNRRYSTLVERLREKRRDQEVAFVSARKILKKKYKNILSQLRHEQKMTVEHVKRRHTQI